MHFPFLISSEEKSMRQPPHAKTQEYINKLKMWV